MMVSARRPGHLFSVALTLTSLLLAASADARPSRPAPPLAAPGGTVVNVSSEAQLQSAIRALRSNTTIVLAPGTYRLSSTLWINGTFTNVGIRGATNNSDDVVILGPGMGNASYGNVPHGIWTGGNVQGVTIANLTIRNFYVHALIFNAGTQSPRVYNVRLADTREQQLKSNPSSDGSGVNNGLVEYAIVEYTSRDDDGYTNGVDIAGGRNWIIRHSQFRNFVGPAGTLAGPAILSWKGASGTLVEGNTFINCGRAIAFGLVNASGTDHSGGRIRNNFIYRSASQPGDVGIGVADSPNTEVLNNTILLSGTYGAPIEYRFSGTTGTVIRNNLLDGAIQARDGATGSQSNNYTTASASMFVNPSAGDLHLVSTAAAAIDHGVALSGVTDDFDGTLRPAGAAFDIGADEWGGTTSAYSISGRVVNASGSGVAGVTLTLAGGRSATAASDSAGGFSFSALPAGSTYTVTPSMSGWTFSPTVLTYTSLSANQTNALFSASSNSVAPSVLLSAPGAGASLPVGTPVAVSATASGGSSTIAGVQFFAGSASIGTDTVAPYSVSWTPASAGAVALTARVTTSAGTTTTSPPVNVNVAAVPPPPAGSTPYSGTPIVVPGRVEMEHYDRGGEGVAYHDTTTGNGGGAFRTENVDLGTTSDTGGGYKLGRTAPTEWVSYTVDITATGTYTLSLRMASVGGGGRFHVEVDGADKTGAMTVPNTGGWETWQTIGKTGVSLTSGRHVLRLVIDANGPTNVVGDFNYIDVVREGGPSAPTVSLTTPVSGASFTAPVSIAIAASATTTSGSITKVDFYNGSMIIGTDTTAPYNMTWNSVGAGSYVLTARATTSGGQTGTSAAVTVGVASAPAPRTFRVAFTASADHSTNVTSYLLKVVPNGAHLDSGTPLLSSNLGKPAPSATQEIVVDQTSVITTLPAGTYSATVTAIGPGGQTRSAGATLVR